MILADTKYAGELNVSDMFTRMMRRGGHRHRARLVLPARRRGQPATRPDNDIPHVSAPIIICRTWVFSALGAQTA
jgi:hypothetical protein